MMMKGFTNLRYYFAKHSSYLFIGGGTGGLNVASHLLTSGIPANEISIIEPSDYHYYQPGWTMVGAGMWQITPTYRKLQDIIPNGIELIKNKVKLINPKSNSVLCQNGEEITYNNLIVGSGLRLNYQKIQGLKEALDNPQSNVGTIYELKYAQKTAKLAQKIKSGRAIFTEPSMPVKCAGAPQKILYLLTDKWRKSNLPIKVDFYKTVGVMFGIPKYSNALSQNASSYNIDVTFKHALVKVEGNQATFENQDNKEKIVKEFDFLHAVPPMSAHQYIAQSGLANSSGYLDCNKSTMRHTTYNNIWGIGDCTSLPNSKTAAAVFSQTQQLIKNLLAVRKNPTLTQLPGKYDGYASCPLFVGKQKLMLAQFKYDGVIDETFFTNQQKPRFLFYLMKRFFFPIVYWAFVPKGRWNGRKGIKFV